VLWGGRIGRPTTNCLSSPPNAQRIAAESKIHQWFLMIGGA
jgi:hypothetical protein